MKTFKTFLTEARQYCFTDETCADVIQEIQDNMKALVSKYKSHEAKTDSIAAAPDTTKFRATRSGMIDFERNVHIHGGQYGVPKTHAYFIKIGGNVDSKISKKIGEELAQDIDDFNDASDSVFKIPGTLACADGYVMLQEEHGTNWGGFGLSTRKYSTYEANEYKEKTEGTYESK